MNICPQCDKPFKGPKKQKYCKRKCAGDAARAKAALALVDEIEQVRQLLKRHLGGAGITETWPRLAVRCGLKPGSRAAVEAFGALVAAGEVGKIGDRYFPAEWIRAP